jgi:hypothetical protein
VLKRYAAGHSERYSAHEPPSVIIEAYRYTHLLPGIGISVNGEERKERVKREESLS